MTRILLPLPIGQNSVIKLITLAGGIRAMRSLHTKEKKLQERTPPPHRACLIIIPSYPLCTQKDNPGPTPLRNTYGTVLDQVPIK